MIRNRGLIERSDTMMSKTSWILLAMALHYFGPVTTRLLQPNKRALIDEESLLSYDRPSHVNNYLTFLSRLSKKNIILPENDRTPPDTHSPKRDNRKFQTQGWR
nr:uncharacterized protein LOC107450001 [Parasteatoda tepidariorum]